MVMIMPAIKDNAAVINPPLEKVSRPEAKESRAMPTSKSLFLVILKFSSQLNAKIMNAKDEITDTWLAPNPPLRCLSDWVLNVYSAILGSLK